MMAPATKQDVALQQGRCRSKEESAEMHKPRVVDYRRRILPLDKDMSLRWSRQSESRTEPTLRELICQRRVQVDGVIVDEPSTGVDLYSQVQVDGMVLPPRRQLAYWILYKPRQVLTSRRRSNRDHADVPLVPEFYSGLPDSDTLMPVGRLDLESEGLLILTNDGSLNRILTSPDFGFQKVYRCLAGRDVPKGSSNLDVKVLLATLVRHALPETHGTKQHSGRSTDRVSSIACVRAQLLDQHVCPRVHRRATSDTHLIVVDVTMASGKNRSSADC